MSAGEGAASAGQDAFASLRGAARGRDPAVGVPPHRARLLRPRGRLRRRRRRPRRSTPSSAGWPRCARAGTTPSATPPWRSRRAGCGAILGFATYAHYCAERLGLAARAVEQRAALERRLWQVPALRDALRQPAALLRAGPAPLAAPRPGHPGLDPQGEGAHLHRAAARAPGRTRRRSCVRRGPSPPRVPKRIALTLFSAFRAVRAVENPLLGRRTVPRGHRAALPRDLEAAREEAEDPVAARPRARSRQLPGPDVQPQGRARAPRPDPRAAPRAEHRSQPGRHLPLSPPARRPRRATSASPAPRRTGSSGSWAGRCGWGRSGGTSRSGGRECPVPAAAQHPREELEPSGPPFAS